MFHHRVITAENQQRRYKGAGRSNTENHCLCSKDHEIDRRCSEKADKDVFRQPEAEG